MIAPEPKRPLFVSITGLVTLHRGRSLGGGEYVVRSEIAPITLIQYVGRA